MVEGNIESSELSREEALKLIQRMRVKLDSIETTLKKANEGLGEAKQELDVIRIFEEIAEELRGTIGDEAKNQGGDV